MVLLEREKLEIEATDLDVIHTALERLREAYQTGDAAAVRPAVRRVLREMAAANYTNQFTDILGEALEAERQAVTAAGGLAEAFAARLRVLAIACLENPDRCRRC